MKSAVIVLSKLPRVCRAAEWSSGDIHGLGREAGTRFHPRCASSCSLIILLYKLYRILVYSSNPDYYLIT